MIERDYEPLTREQLTVWDAQHPAPKAEDPDFERGLLKWLTEDGIDIYNRDHWKAVKKKLNSNEYRYLKTAEVII